MAKQKAGDKVVIDKCLYGHEFEIGETVEIIEVTQDGSKDDYTSEYEVIGVNGETWLIRDNEILGYIE